MTRPTTTRMTTKRRRAWAILSACHTLQPKPWSDVGAAEPKPSLGSCALAMKELQRAKDAISARICPTVNATHQVIDARWTARQSPAFRAERGKKGFAD